MRTYTLVMLIAAAVTFIVTPMARHLARYVHAITPVRARDVHTTPIPRLGGLAMLVGFFVAVLLSARIPFLAAVFSETQQIVGVALAAAWVVLLGVADDLWDLDWWAKLGGQILAGLILASYGVVLVTFPIAGLTVGSARLSAIVTIFVVVAAINAVNFVDGLDGLAAGMIAIGGTAFFLYAYLLTRVSSPENYSSLAAVILAALVGICVGFLPHNFHPARIFMGDTGAMLIGLLIAAPAIIVTGNIDPERVTVTQALPAYLPILLPLAVLAVPLIDMLLAVVRRVGAGHSPFHPDRGHIHHRLLDLGHTHRGAVLIMYAWTVVVSSTAVLMVLIPTPWALGIGGVLSVIAYGLTRTKRSRAGVTGD
ncbi:MAG: undecaprenyl/decaprenyl-phosphate alpha-N-acetylglucosaminyl 1-phosphate transferase [Ruaniaceae bacterium]|nr:undecaprenyl/decaprenyl-phosphate alpha-N-acetylglucosaminyl 1-phosphate transferase [Ruaniaceae bacterium]